MNVFQNTSTIIFATDRGGRSEQANDNIRGVARLYMEQRNIAYTECLGGYSEEGHGDVTEVSFMVHNPTKEQAKEIKALAFAHCQDSIIHINSGNHSTLVYADGSREVVGKMSITDEENKGVYWTLMGETYYKTRPYNTCNGIHKPSN